MEASKQKDIEAIDSQMEGIKDLVRTGILSLEQGKQILSILDKALTRLL